MTNIPDGLDYRGRTSGHAMWLNSLRRHADEHGINWNDTRAVIEWAQRSTDEELLGLRNFGARGLVWLRSQHRPSSGSAPLRSDDV